MLFIRVAQIIASQPSPSVLLTVAAFTLTQVGAGALTGMALTPLAERLGQPSGGSGSSTAPAADSTSADSGR